MGRQGKTLDPTISAAHYLGAEIRRRRTEQGMTQQDLALRVLHSADLVRKIESAERSPSRDFVVLCDDVLGACGTLVWLWPLLDREQIQRSGRGTGVGHPRGFDSAATDRPVLDWLVGSVPPASSGVADSVVVDVEDLRSLRRADQSGGAATTYPRLLAHLGDGFDDLVARSPRLAAGYLELAGYEAVDLGADGCAQRHYLRALDMAARAGDHRYGGYLIGVSLAHLALHAGDDVHAERLAAVALRGTGPDATPAMRAAFHAVLARARARRGDERGCTEELLRAEGALAASEPADEPEWMGYFGEADLADERAHCLFDLRRDGPAQREASTAVTLLPPSRVRRLAMDTALSACALARAGDLDGACHVGRKAVAHAARTTSFRSTHRVTLMLAELQPHTGAPVVRDLVDYAAAVLPPAPTISLAPTR
jgi:Helix-turn-helix domain